MTASGDEEVLLSIGASPARRWFGTGALTALALVLLWLALRDNLGAFWRMGFFLAAALAGWSAERLRVATLDKIELTPTVLRTSSGRRLARVANVRAVERGAFAFKPSNGFLVRLKEPEGRGWAPGLWWQRGTWLGIGGVVPGAQSRAMSEMLSVLTRGDRIDGN